MLAVSLLETEGKRTRRWASVCPRSRRYERAFARRAGPVGFAAIHTKEEADEVNSKFQILSSISYTNLLYIYQTTSFGLLGCDSGKHVTLEKCSGNKDAKTGVESATHRSRRHKFIVIRSRKSTPSRTTKSPSTKWANRIKSRTSRRTHWR